MSDQIPRVPTFEEMRDRAWNNMLDWLEGRKSWTNLGPHSPYTHDVIAVMDRQELEKWLSVHESMARLADQFPDLEGAEEELAALEADDGQL